MARCFSNQASETLKGCGVSRYVRTRPDLRDLTSPQSSSTSRCCRNEGSDMLNGSASSLTAAGPLLSRSSTARRVGSASPWNTQFNWEACWLGKYLTVVGKEYLGQYLNVGEINFRLRLIWCVRRDGSR